MAGDWIKMRVNLQSHPKVVCIMSACGADKFRTIGGLHAVWSVFDAHSENGKLSGYTPELMDQVIGWEGFSSAMISVGWLQQDGETLVATSFEDHNGQTAKRRAQETERKRKARKVSAPPADEKRTREEKRREENKKENNKRKTCLGTFTPSEANTKFATDNKLDIKHELEQFKNHCLANDKRYVEWQAGFRTWLGNAAKWSGGNNGNQSELGKAAWQIVCEKIRSCGRTGDPDFEDKIITDVINKLGGWMPLCTQSERQLDFTKNKFLSMYREGMH